MNLTARAPNSLRPSQSLITLVYSAFTDTMM